MQYHVFRQGMCVSMFRDDVECYLQPPFCHYGELYVMTQDVIILGLDCNETSKGWNLPLGRFRKFFELYDPKTPLVSWDDSFIGTVERNDSGKVSCDLFYPFTYIATPTPRGFPSLGNTCFLNSVLQIFFAYRPFIEALLSIPELSRFYYADFSNRDDMYDFVNSLNDELVKWVALFRGEPFNGELIGRFQSTTEFYLLLIEYMKVRGIDVNRFVVFVRDEIAEAPNDLMDMNILYTIEPDFKLNYKFVKINETLIVQRDLYQGDFANVPVHVHGSVDVRGNLLFLRGGIAVINENHSIAFVNYGKVWYCISDEDVYIVSLREAFDTLSKLGTLFMYVR